MTSTVAPAPVAALPTATPTALTSVLIVDDQALQRAGIRLLLDGEPDIHVLADAATPQEAALMAEALQPDVVLMHLSAPLEESIHATRSITASARGAAVLVVTAFGPGNFAYSALSAGARGLLVKASGPELLTAIRTLRTGGAVLSPTLTKRLIELWFREPRALGTAGTSEGRARAKQLTVRESQVLQLLARGRSNKEIAATLRLSLPTVKTHIKHILTKLDLHSRLQAVAFAYEHHIVEARTA